MDKGKDEGVLLGTRIGENISSIATGIWNLSDYSATPNFNAGVKGKVSISGYDKNILRKLAARVAELASRPIEQEKRKLWTEHNSLKPTRPLVFCDPENGWNEIIKEDQLACRGELARRWETVLLKEIFWGESMLDDKVIEPYFEIACTHTESDWGLVTKLHGAKPGGAVTWEAPVKEYSDTDKLHFPTIEIDDKTTEETLELANDTFGDLLNIKLKNRWWWSFGLTYEFILLRGLSQMMIDMIDNPKLVHKIMKILSDGFLKKLDFLEKNNLLSLNNYGYIGSGGLGYIDELPGKDFDNSRVKPENMWGFSESQESVGISAKMFEEFIFPYQTVIQKRFGLNYYGCCEPLDPKWHIIKNIPNLRRVSASPWANIPKMSEFLQDKYVMARKPSPTPLAEPVLDEDFIRKQVRRELEITKGCIVEFIMKDNNTIGNNPLNVINWVRVVKEEIDKMYS